MSIKLMSQVWDLDLPHNEKLVLLAFADHANDEGMCYPSIGRIAWKCDYGRRAVQRILRSLEDRKLISIIDNNQGGRGKLPLYFIDLEMGVKKTPFAPPTSERVSSESLKGGISGQKGVAPDTKGVTAKTPESSVEPPDFESSVNHQGPRFAKKPENQFRDTDGNLWELRDSAWLLVEAVS